GFALLVGGDFALDSTRLWMPGARLLLDEQPLARLDVQAEAAIAPYTPRQHPGVAGWDFISGILRARGTATPGDVLVDLRLDHGRVVPGSRATLRAGGAANPLSALFAVETNVANTANTAGPQFVLRVDHGRVVPGSRATLRAGGAANPLSALFAVETNVANTANTAGPQFVLRA